MPQEGESRTLIRRAEDLLSILSLAVMTLLPLIEVAGRQTFNVGVAGSILIVQHLTLVAAFLGAALAARSGRLLALATVDFMPAGVRSRARLFTGAIGAGITAWLIVASLDVLRAFREAGDILAMEIPVWAVTAVMPLGLAAVAVRLIRDASDRWPGRLLACAGLLLPALLQLAPQLQGRGLLLPGLLLIGLATLLGLPLFAAIGGSALLLFWEGAVPVAAVPIETVRLTSFPVLPAVPLFTLSGFILAAGGASERLVRVFTTLVGWLPGGTAIVTTLVFAFFTSFTGASGVTILSLGGLLLPVLLKSGYPEPFSLGLITVSGSIGLLLPPSLPVILYGVRATQPIDKLFLGGMVPGMLLVLLVAAWGVRQDLLTGGRRKPFVPGAAARAVWEAKWELLMPIVVLIGLLGGFATNVEAAALTVLYALVVECFVYRDLSFRRGLPRVFVDAATLIGGFLIILGMALGLTNYLIDAEIPMRLLAWVKVHVASRFIFLLVLNVFLLLVGALMDIYSAIFVVVPLIAPLATAYGVDPIHLGIIFLANLELGYLTPPMGENLFLASYRFGHPVMKLFAHTIPFYVILLVGVLLITYVPGMTLGLVRLWGG